MQIIKKDQAMKCANSENCKLEGYAFEDKGIDIAIAEITDRYPDKGYCEHAVSKELVYVLEGEGKLHFEDKTVEFSKGDAILILNKEKYYWETKYCKVALPCVPAFNVEQYRIVD